MSKIEKLKSYKALVDEGVITQDEFETIKKAILSDNSKVNQDEPTEKNIFDNIKQTQDKLIKNPVVGKLNEAVGYVEPTDEISPKSKIIAALLSIIPGMGFLYLQNYKFAVVMWIWWFFALVFDFAYAGLGACTLIFALIFAFGKQGSWGGMFDRFLVDGQGRKLVTAKK